MEKTMWVSANLLFSAEQDGEQESERIWEERIVLFESSGNDSVKSKAEAYGRAAEHEYRTIEGHLLKWKFQRVERCFEIESDGLIEGTEVFSRFLRDSEVKSLLRKFE